MKVVSLLLKLIFLPLLLLWSIFKAIVITLHGIFGRSSTSQVRSTYGHGDEKQNHLLPSVSLLSRLPDLSTHQDCYSLPAWKI
jgi:hypothetical protein